jgi:hypothetical protein
VTVERAPRQYAGDIYDVLEQRDLEPDPAERAALDQKAKDLYEAVPHGIKTWVKFYVEDWRRRAKARRAILRRRR